MVLIKIISFDFNKRVSVAKKKLGVKCPVCKRSFYYYDSEFRPFCSHRCKSIDLGHWIAEDYTIGSSELLSEPDVEQVVKHFEQGGEHEQ